MGHKRPNDDLGEQWYSSGNAPGISMSHIVGVLVQGQHGPHCLSMDISGNVTNSRASCSQSNDFSLMHEFSRVLKNSSFYNIATHIEFDGFCQLPPRLQQIRFTWLFATNRVCFAPSFTETILKSITRQKQKQVPPVKVCSETIMHLHFLIIGNVTTFLTNSVWFMLYWVHIGWHWRPVLHLDFPIG